MKLRGADIILECLLEHGVDTVFGCPGEASINICDSFYRYNDKIRLIQASSEQHAGHAADGYARATGKTGVVTATGGLVAAGLVKAIATANIDNIPFIAISFNNSWDLQTHSHELDITGITIPVTKHNFLVRDVSSLADTIRKAFFFANDGRKGAVLIDMPENITGELCNYRRQKPFKITLRSLPPRALDNAADMIKNSKRPLIYCGAGVVSSGAENELQKFADLIDAPVCSSLNGQNGFDRTSPRYIGIFDRFDDFDSDCDLLIVLGTRLPDQVSFSNDAKILHIDIDDANIICDVKTALSYFNKKIKQKDNKEWLKSFDKNDVSREITNTREQIIKTLEHLTDNEVLISSGALSAAIGAKIGCPDKSVINVADDHSIGMNLGELATLSKYKVPVIQLLLNTNGSTDYQKLGQAFGVKYLRLENPEEAMPDLRNALRENETGVIIDCLIDERLEDGGII